VRAIDVIDNAKVQRPSACNSLDTLLLNEKIAAKIAPLLVARMNQQKVTLVAEPQAFALLQAAGANQLRQAGDEDFDTEWLSLTLGVKVVADVKAAIAHLQEHNACHSDAILTNDLRHAELFINGVGSLKTDAENLGGYAQSVGGQAKNLGTYAGSIGTSLQETQTDLQIVSGCLTQIQNLLTKTKTSTAQLESALKQIAEGTGQLKTSSKTLASSIKKLDEGAKTLNSGTKTAANGAKKLSKGAKTLDNGMGQMTTGIATLKNGAVTLNKGMLTFRKDGIEKLVNTINDDAKEILDRADACKR
jgi:X-X-X-Leu-X-X-Gly heptad repeat protein